MVVVPTVKFIQQSLTIDPSGSRHLNSGAAGFIRELNTTAGHELNFGNLNNTISGTISDTKLCYARISSLGDASGIFNLRVFLVNATAFNTGTYRFLERRTFDFVPNLILSVNDLDMPVILPNHPNFSGTVQPGWPRGSPWMSGILDADVSMYLYTAIFADTNVPVGTYGGAGAGSFRYRMVYDFS